MYMQRLLAIILATVTSVSAAAGQWWNVVDCIRLPENFVVGYGSLVNPRSQERTLGEPVPSVPIRISHEFGYRRVWNYKITDMSTALGIEKTSPDYADTINGVIFPVVGDDLEALDIRERNYDRIEVPWEFIQSVGWMRLPSEGTVWMYIPKEESVQQPTLKEPIIQSYIDLAMEGYLSYSDDFGREFIETTHYWPRYWVNDRLMSRRPWEYTPASGKVDRLLRNHLPVDTDSGQSLYTYRRHQANYAVGVWADEE